MKPTQSRTGEQARGFTLIELMVVVGLMVSLLGLLLYGTSSARDQTYVEIAQNEVASVLRQTIGWARFGRAFGAVDAYTYDRGYGVYLEKGSGQIIVYGRGNPDNDTTDHTAEMYDASRSVQTINLERTTIAAISGVGGTAPSLSSAHVSGWRGSRDYLIVGINEATGSIEPPYTAIGITLVSGSAISTVWVNSFGSVY